MNRSVLIATVPKCGTHLLGNLLEEFDYPPSGLFFINPGEANVYVSDEWGANRAQNHVLQPGRPHFWRNTTPISFEAALSCLPRPSFFLSHFSPRDLPCHLLPQLHVVVGIRELRSALTSAFQTERAIHILSRDLPFMRSRGLSYLGLLEDEFGPAERLESPQAQFHAYLRAVCPKWLGICLELAYWDEYKAALFVKYEDIVGREGSRTMRKLAAHLGATPRSGSLEDALRRALDRPSPTDNRQIKAEVPDAPVVWDETCEDIFLRSHLDRAWAKLESCAG